MSFQYCVHKDCNSQQVMCHPEGYNQTHPWMRTYQCLSCQALWFTCNDECMTTHGVRRRCSYFTKLWQVVRHYKTCHGSRVLKKRLTVAKPYDVRGQVAMQVDRVLEPAELSFETLTDYQNDTGMDDCLLAAYDVSFFTQPFLTECTPHAPLFDGDLEPDMVEPDLHYDVPIRIKDPETNRERFLRLITEGNAVTAASVLVRQASFQDSRPSHDMLPLPNILLFLYLAKLVMATGRLQLSNLSKVLSILYPYAHKLEPQWAPIPCTLSGFRSKILNVSNTNSLVSILPIPCPETLPDGHGYTPFRTILSHALMMKSFLPAETKDPKWQSIASCEKFLAFLRSIPEPSTALAVLQIAVGIIVWTDGWDTSTGCKSNRSPMHTGTVTLVFVNVSTGLVVGIATYPNMGGPGKIDHGPVFQRFQEDIAESKVSITQTVSFPRVIIHKM